MDPTDALDTLKTRLQSRFTADYLATLGTVDVVKQDSESEAEQVGHPLVLLWIEPEPERDEEMSSAQSEALRVIVRARVKANAFNGALNASPIDNGISKALTAICKSDYSYFRDLGMFSLRCSGGSESTQEEVSGLSHTNEHRIGFSVFP